MTPVQHPIKKLILSVWIFHQIFILPHISPALCSEIQNEATSKILTVCSQKAKNSNFTNSLHRQIQKDLKDPNLIFIFTMKLVYTCSFFHWLRSGDLFVIPVAQNQVTFSLVQPPQITQKCTAIRQNYSNFPFNY